MKIAFESRTIEDIIKQLEKDRTTFARETLEQMKLASPTSLKVTLEMLKRSVKSTLKSCLEREYYVSLKMVETHDFKEGIRARLIDKDFKPKWKPQKAEEISDDQIASFFKEIPNAKFDIN
ncbi:hypothetical protein B4U80_05041 [Leptotrombidium deliense]|uniref:3-hydroxyisobutyryl-CoA hydrolase, mitochondrial n=1 Tax=Leptotrombidium deliense TaxID=299467 RepID=A0A443SH71_9ACAR|nr:hypothetical protein B4U80_05041 [Leptotrombidium deliense]